VPGAGGERKRQFQFQNECGEREEKGRRGLVIWFGVGLNRWMDLVWWNQVGTIWARAFVNYWKPYALNNITIYIAV
jgi:hypothetical protein